MVWEDMTPYYSHNGITLHNQDCMEAMKEMPDKAFELAIVDPPYGIGESNAGFESRGCSSPKWKRARPTIYAKKDWDTEPPPPKYFIELFRVSKNQIIWGGNYFVKHLQPSMGWIFWDKRTSGDYSDGELAYTSFERALKMFAFTWAGFRKGEPCTRIHPTQKPVALYEWLLKNYAKKGDKILDTHGGSCSLAIACDIMGFDVDIYEIDEDYFNAAVDRLKRHQSQLVLPL
jgi:site-specific DNA-methyltransferase (adenine-specific)